ncbi:hypothetical protein MKW92_000144 [Papaver armeniacum]|nr:hypothetical protein MKW92_000144 [Papaver armeniacum]
MASSSLLISPSPTPDPSEALLHTAKLNLPSNIKIKNPQQPHLHFTSLITCIALSSSIAFAFLFFYPSPSHPTALKTPIQHIACPLQKLKKPVIILISSDGFRFGYQYKTDTPNIHRLINNGTEAEMGLILFFQHLLSQIITQLSPVFTLNHMELSITDLLIQFPSEGFIMQSKEPKWVARRTNLGDDCESRGIAATYFWPGSEVNKGSWNCDTKYCKRYNSSVPFEDRVDSVLEYFDLPSDELPSLMTLYFEDPDHQGHLVGPDDPEITKAELILIKRGGFKMLVIMLGDHGMVGTCDQKLVFFDDLAKWVKVPKEWVQSYSPSVWDLVRLKNGMNLKVYLKEDLQKTVALCLSYLIPPIVGLGRNVGVLYGYDNAFFSMRTIFIGHGPQFARGCKVPSFENVQIYNLQLRLKIKRSSE